ncbi:hypothetical protein BCR43DRAFT_114634 [Syncephalastrum racemosum]|uniref:Uncharacterized protein n=1 Tax=Syncephalastrum racemosum TaxID=13706 RepID=A0A1X2H0L2_SYNRA|nr:hypothetical protein BCR43DRAFT_114634 [Syncephalastrum racemosum]
MVLASKWKLSTGTIVEDKLFEFGLTSEREHAAHSFIINVSDPVWTERFTASELQEISQSRSHPLPPASDALLEISQRFYHACNCYLMAPPAHRLTYYVGYHRHLRDRTGLLFSWETRALVHLKVQQSGSQMRSHDEASKAP